MKKRLWKRNSHAEISTNHSLDHRKKIRLTPLNRANITCPTQFVRRNTPTSTLRRWVLIYSMYTLNGVRVPTFSALLSLELAMSQLRLIVKNSNVSISAQMCLRHLARLFGIKTLNLALARLTKRANGGCTLNRTALHKPTLSPGAPISCTEDAKWLIPLIHAPKITLALLSGPPAMVRVRKARVMTIIIRSTVLTTNWKTMTANTRSAILTRRTTPVGCRSVAVKPTFAFQKPALRCNSTASLTSLMS